MCVVMRLVRKCPSPQAHRAGKAARTASTAGSWGLCSMHTTSEVPFWGLLMVWTAKGLTLRGLCAPVRFVMLHIESLPSLLQMDLGIHRAR